MHSSIDHSTTAATSTAPNTAQAPARRGFAGMTPEQHRAIASAGGRAAHALQRAHQFTLEEARRAGRLGGAIVSQDREHMAAIGRKGGRARRESPPSPHLPNQALEPACV